MASLVVDEQVSTPPNEDYTNGLAHPVMDLGNGIEPQTTSQDELLASSYTTASYSQAKRALEAHIQETDRRIQEASKLGTSLVEQRKRMSERLKDVEQHEGDGEVGHELKQKLADLEREYNEVGKDAARSSFQRSRQTSGDPIELGNGSNGQAGQAISARKQRNQASGRIHDIEFATEISTSLLGQVRHLQSLLAEKDEALRMVNADNARLQADAEDAGQKLRNLDDNEQKFKDENWHLETQLQDIVAQLKDSSTREQRLAANFQTARQEKSTIEREYTELRESHNKLNDEHSTLRKAHDSELINVKRQLMAMDSEKASLQSRIDELTSQNTELARTAAANVRQEPVMAEQPEIFDTEEFDEEQPSPEHSRPSSPTKGMSRHGALESETLRTSIHHAHRMIQNLKNTIHREKTEKMELRRMLQDARDELEARRGDGGASGANAARKKKVTTSKDGFKKPARPDQLGGAKNAREEITTDPSWEDDDGSPTRPRYNRNASLVDTGTDSDAFHTANEQDSNATESEAFHTGAESLAGDSSEDLTETEANRPFSSSLAAARARNRASFMSSASDDFEHTLSTPPSNQSQYKNKLLRGLDSAKGSPASFVSNSSTPAGNQNLAAELEDIDDNTSVAQSTPSGARDSAAVSPEADDRRQTVLGPIAMGSLAKPQMVDAATLTDPWVPSSATDALDSPQHTLDNGGLAGTTSDGLLNNHSQERQISAKDDTRALPSLTGTDPQRAEETHEPVTRAQELTMSQFSSEQIEPVVPVPSARTATIAPMLPAKSAARTSWVRENFNLFGASASGEAQNESPTTASAEPATSSAAAVYDTFVKGQETDQDTTNAAGAFTGSESFIPSPVDLSANKNLPTRDIPDTKRELQSQPAAPFRAISGNARPPPGTAMSRDPDTNMLATKFDGQNMGPMDATHGDLIRAAGELQSGQSINNGGTGDPFSSLSVSGRSGDNWFLPDSPSPRSPKRPGSSGSSRRGTSTPPVSQRPPLPPDHKQVIAAASRNSSTVALAASPIISSTPSKGPAQIGQRSLGDAISSAGASKVAPPTRSRASSAQGRADMSAPGTRRSSVSSFASEIEERFNIHKNTYPAMDGFEMSNADPRMIQAITQTMIGEFLWKYTRKAGRGQHSENRHRRFFWIHPYTRTLYWSGEDPSRAGRQELKAKSVAIEAVRVVTDANPMPPGLHQKSIIVVTPGRSIKFTAPTSQRHETWFNALSYLLLRTETDNEVGSRYQSIRGDGNSRSRASNIDRSNPMSSLTAEDISEFNPAWAGRSQSRLATDPRASAASPLSVKQISTGSKAQALSASRGRASLPSTATVRGQSASKRQQGTPTRTISSTEVAPAVSTNDFKKPFRPASVTQSAATPSPSKMSSISSKFRPSSGTGFLSLRNRNRVSSAAVDAPASPRPDSADMGSFDMAEHSPMRGSEDMGTPSIRRQSDTIENVRACCDGKHDVGHLHHRGRPASVSSRNSFAQ